MYLCWYLWLERIRENIIKILSVLTQNRQNFIKLQSNFILKTALICKFSMFFKFLPPFQFTSHFGHFELKPSVRPKLWTENPWLRLGWTELKKFSSILNFRFWTNQSSPSLIISVLMHMFNNCAFFGCSTTSWNEQLSRIEYLGWCFSSIFLFLYQI